MMPAIEQVQKFWTSLTAGGRATLATAAGIIITLLASLAIGFGWWLLCLFFAGILLAVYKISNYGWARFWDKLTKELE